MYVNINRSELFLYKYFFAVLHYTLLEIETNFVRTLPSFQDRMETDVSLLHENSLCFYNLFGFL